MAYDRSTVRTSVLNELDNQDYDTTVLNQYINDINRRIANKHKWPFMETTETIALSENDSEATPSSSVQRIFTLRIISPEEYEEDISDYFLDPREFDQAYPDLDNEDTSTPKYWTYTNGKILLAPRPDQSYTLELRYYKNPTDISTDATAPDIPEEFQEVLVTGVVAKALTRDDFYDEAQVIQQTHEELLQDMLIRLAQRQTGTPLIMRSNKGRYSRRFFNGD